MEQTPKFDRRRLLKALAATGGVVAASALVPSKWSKPQVGVGALPVHAQTSGGYDLLIEACWEGPCNVDVTVMEPGGGGEFIGPNNPNGIHATHHGDVTEGGCEVITVPAGQAVGSGDCEDDHYHIDLWNFCEGSAEVLLTITTPASVASAPFLVPGDGNYHCAANVCFPSGVVMWIGDSSSGASGAHS
jgi:hypothetical protein